MVKNENLDICRECGGMCCLKCGCDYSPEDFKDRSYKGLLKELSKGDKSIVAMLKFNKRDDNWYNYEAFLYIRARNTNRDIIDLVSMKTKCSMLTGTGCMYDYEHRPFNGRNLKPMKDKDGYFACSPVVDPKNVLLAWKPYQKGLKRIVLEYTGMGLDKKIKEDVRNLFYDFLCENYVDVSILEKEELRRFIPLLARTFPFGISYPKILPSLFVTVLFARMAPITSLLLFLSVPSTAIVAK